MFGKFMQILILPIVALLMILVVSVFGDSLLGCAWGNVAINLISDIFFVIVLGSVFMLPYTLMTKRVRKFFGVSRQEPIQIYISGYKDNTTRTQSVMITEEYEVANELRATLNKQFPSFVHSLARLFGVDLDALDIPDIVIKVSPLEEVKQWHYSGSLTLIGGPTRNKLASYFLQCSDPWVTFDDKEKKFIEWKNRKTQSSGEPLEESSQLAIVERLIVEGRVIILAFGYGEIETAAAVRHLAQCWSELVKKNQEFAQLLYVDRLGQIQIEKEYS